MAVIKPTREGLAWLTAKKLPPEPTPDTGSLDWLKEELDEAIVSGEKLWEEPTTVVSGSAVSTSCVRALTFKLLGHRVPFNAKTLRIFRTGRAIEKEIIDNMRASPVFVDANIMIAYGREKEPTIVGHADVAVRRKSDDKLLLGEIKSIHEKAFDRLPEEHQAVLASESPLFKSHERYVKQLNTYLGGRWYGETDEGFFLFEAKNTQRQKVYYILFDDELLEPDLRRAHEAHDFTYCSGPICCCVPGRLISRKGNSWLLCRSSGTRAGTTRSARGATTATSVSDCRRGRFRWRRSRERT